MAVVVVDESNTIVWMNATAYTMFKVSTESTTEDTKWDSLVFSLEPDGTEPCDLLEESNKCNSLSPFKAFVTESNMRVEVNVMKVQFGGTTYACCYLTPDTKYVASTNNSRENNLITKPAGMNQCLNVLLMP